MAEYKREGVGTWQNTNEKELVRGRIQTRRSWYVAEYKREGVSTWQNTNEKELVRGRIQTRRS